MRVFCDMVTDGGGYTFHAVKSGIETFRSTDWDSCKEVGLTMIVPRTKEHLDFMLLKYGISYFSVVPGITKPTNGGSYKHVAMKNQHGNFNDGTEGRFTASDWQPVTGKTWFLRDTPYGEPNGDYTANCWLRMWLHRGEVRFNDWRCNYATTKYVCSTNDKEDSMIDPSELMQAVATGHTGANLALDKPTAQSSECCGGDPARAVDGNPSPNWNDASCTHTNKEASPWWRVDLGCEVPDNTFTATTIISAASHIAGADETELKLVLGGNGMYAGFQTSQAAKKKAREEA